PRAAPPGLGGGFVPARRCMLEVVLTPTAVTISAVPPGTADALKSGPRVAEEPIVLVGADQRPVVWQAARWDEPDAHHRHLTVDASEMALRAELSFAYDAATGFLSLQNVLRHVGRDGEIDLRAATSFVCLWRGAGARRS